MSERFRSFVASPSRLLLTLVVVASVSACSAEASAPTGGDELRVSWDPIAKPLYRSVEASGGIIDNKLYQFGGYLPEPGFYKPVTTASVYDVATDEWSYIEPIPRGLTHSAHVVDGRRFILLGGVAAQGGGEVPGIKTVFTYDVDTNSWGTLPDLPEARGSGAAALIGRTVHFFGGVDENRVEKGDHWTLDLDNLAAGWQSATPFSSPRSHFAAVVVDNSVYTVGGMTGWEASAVEQSDVYRYDSAARTWTRQADMPEARSHVGESTVVVDGRIWMFGGEPEYPKASAETYVYEIAGDSWQRSPSDLPKARVSGIGGAIGNTVFYVGGSVYEDGAWKGTIG